MGDWGFNRNGAEAVRVNPYLIISSVYAFLFPCRRLRLRASLGSTFGKIRGTTSSFLNRQEYQGCDRCSINQGGSTFFFVMSY